MNRQRTLRLVLVAGLAIGLALLSFSAWITLFGGHTYSPSEIAIGSITAAGDGSYDVTFKIPRTSIMVKCSEVVVDPQDASGLIPVHFVAKTDFGLGVQPRSFRQCTDRVGVFTVRLAYPADQVSPRLAVHNHGKSPDRIYELPREGTVLAPDFAVGR